MRFGEAIGALLAQRGVQEVFGIPGVHTLELFRNIEQQGVSVTVPRHEQGAGFIADGYARVTGRPGVCFLVTGPGVLNAMTAIAQAWHDSIPLLVIASTVETAQAGRHAGTLHDTPDLSQTLTPYTLFSRNITAIDDVVAAFDEAWSRWATERPRPVYIGIPLDVLGEHVELSELFSPAEMQHPVPAPDELERAARALADAESPVIIAGGGSRHAAIEIERCAVALDAPVVLTANAKGLLEHAHPLNVGVSIPFTGTQQLLAEADAVLAVGTELSDAEYLFTGSDPVRLQNIVRVDIDAAAAHPDQTNPTIVADAQKFLELLAPRLPQRARGRGIERADTARSALQRAFHDDPYREWVEALRAGIADNTIVAVDSAQLAYQAHQFMPISPDMTWLAPYGFGTLGPAIPMAIGAAIAAPQRPVVALAGDGSALFTIAELATAADLHRQLTVVVWVNDGYREIEASFERAGIAPIGVATTASDFAMLARGLGASSVTVRRPEDLTVSLRDACEVSSLTVILIQAPAHLRVAPTLPTTKG